MKQLLQPGVSLPCRHHLLYIGWENAELGAGGKVWET